MKFEQALQAMREGKKVTTNWHLPFFYYIEDKQMFQGWYDRPPTKVYNLGVPELLLNDNWVIVEIDENGVAVKDGFETDCIEKANIEEDDDEKAREIIMEMKKAYELQRNGKEKYPYYSYNTDVGNGMYKIIFETDNRNGYRQLEEYIRENFIDKRDTKKLINKIRLQAENSSLNDSHIITVLCDCIDEQHEQIEQLQKEVERLNEKMNYCNI